MEKEQQREWAEAQNITFSVDLVNATKKQLKFLAAVDRHQHVLFESTALQRAIFRYKNFWIPLLTKHSENPLSEEPLVVPLDCEWIWHCHRLNSLRYKLDCEKMFGKILDNEKVISSVQGTTLKHKTEEIWKTMYPEEPYELEVDRNFSTNIFSGTQDEKFTSYDLVSASTRQTSFYSKVSGLNISDDQFLQEAVARYKGFLHLIRTNKRKNIRQFGVPTLDIDLIWHSHLLHPVSYCNDLKKILAEVVGHDDSVKGTQDTEFSDTGKQWEETFGLSYEKIKVMYKGVTPFPSNYDGMSKEYDGDSKVTNYGAEVEVKSALCRPRCVLFSMGNESIVAQS